MCISLLDSVPHWKMWEFPALEDWLPTIGIIRGRALVVSGVVGVLNCSYVTSDVPEMHPKFGDDCSLTPETALPPGLKLYCRAKGLFQGTQEFVDNMLDFRI